MILEHKSSLFRRIQHGLVWVLPWEYSVVRMKPFAGATGKDEAPLSGVKATTAHEVKQVRPALNQQLDSNS